MTTQSKSESIQLPPPNIIQKKTDEESDLCSFRSSNPSEPPQTKRIITSNDLKRLAEEEDDSFYVPTIYEKPAQLNRMQQQSSRHSEKTEDSLLESTATTEFSEPRKRPFVQKRNFQQPLNHRKNLEESNEKSNVNPPKPPRKKITFKTYTLEDYRNINIV